MTTGTCLQRRTLLAAAIAVIGLAGPARAWADPDADPVDLQVVDRETGLPLPVWRHDGRLFVAGQPGARYALRVANHTDGRVLVVMSVDGVNILSGETAGYGQRGYVLLAHQTHDVKGWRKSDTEVAAFTFASLPQSYAARTGRPVDIGVIGIAVFKERVPAPVAAPITPVPLVKPDWRGRSDAGASGTQEVVVTASRQGRSLAAPPPPPPIAAAPPAPAPAPPPRSAQPRDEKLGTAHGEREGSVVTLVAFERATPYPQSVRQIEYDTYDNLVAGGVIPRPRDPPPRPRPFPSRPDAPGYVPDPPGRP